MKKAVTLALTFSLVPAIAAAQSVSVQVEAGASAPAPKMSVQAEARIDSLIARAEARGLPAEPLRQRAAEGQAKGASEAHILSALARMEANMQTTQRVFARLGRTATDGEIAAGAEVVAQGTTEEQLEQVVKHADKQRGLEVALTTLASLTANGEGVANAIARVEAKLAERASDHAIAALASANGAAHSAHGSAAIGASATAGKGSAGVAGAAAGAVNAAGGAAGGAASGAVRAGGKP